METTFKSKINKSRFVLYLILLLTQTNCNAPKTEQKIEPELSDLNVRFTRLDINETPFSDYVLIYGELEILANYDSISISLDTTNDEIKEKKRSEIDSKEFWEVYDACCANYTDSVNELISVRNLETVYQNKSNGGRIVCFEGGNEDYRPIHKGEYKQYYFRTSDPGRDKYDSINFHIVYKKNGETQYLRVGRHR